MRSVWMLTSLLALGGCAGSIFDPAPYRPSSDQAVLRWQGTPYDQVSVLQFSSISDAASKLTALGSGYADARDRIMRQQLLIDIPAIGLGVATVANGIFRGAKDATLALGLSSAAVGGTRLYFGPQIKTVAYTNAASALDCASSVAAVLFVENKDEGDVGRSVSASLEDYIRQADDQITSGHLNKQDSTTLLAARDAAQKNLDDLDAAINTIDTAPAQLQSFAVTVIRGATTKVVTGTQNIDAVLTLVKSSSGAPASTTTTTSPKPGPPGVQGLAAPAKLGAPQITAALQKLSAQAAPISKRIGAVWGGLTSCSNTS